MPVLGHLACQIKWTKSEEAIFEHGVSYGDGRVECHLAIPDASMPFFIHLTSKGFIAPGLAMFVFIDGSYQCNRNRTNLRLPRDGKKSTKADLDLRVRQKEAYEDRKTFGGNDWTFDKLGDTSVGTVEIMVLRCEKEPRPKPPSNTFNLPLRGARTWHQKTSASPEIHNPSNFKTTSFGFDGIWDDLWDKLGPVEDDYQYSFNKSAGVKQSDPLTSSQPWITATPAPQKDPYCHKAGNSPRYVDSIDKPFATFIFRYGKPSIIEARLGATVRPQLERERLKNKTKEELIEEVLGTKKNDNSHNNSNWDASKSPSFTTKPHATIPTHDYHGNKLSPEMVAAYTTIHNEEQAKKHETQGEGWDTTSPAGQTATTEWGNQDSKNDQAPQNNSSLEAQDGNNNTDWNAKSGNTQDSGQNDNTADQWGDQDKGNGDSWATQDTKPTDQWQAQDKGNGDSWGTQNTKPVEDWEAQDKSKGDSRKAPDSKSKSNGGSWGDQKSKPNDNWGGGNQDLKSNKNDDSHRQGPMGSSWGDKPNAKSGSHKNGNDSNRQEHGANSWGNHNNSNADWNGHTGSKNGNSWHQDQKSQKGDAGWGDQGRSGSNKDNKSRGGQNPNDGQWDMTGRDKGKQKSDSWDHGNSGSRKQNSNNNDSRDNNNYHSSSWPQGNNQSRSQGHHHRADDNRSNEKNRHRSNDHGYEDHRTETWVVNTSPSPPEKSHSKHSECYGGSPRDGSSDHQSPRSSYDDRKRSCHNHDSRPCDHRHQEHHQHNECGSRHSSQCSHGCRKASDSFRKSSNRSSDCKNCSGDRDRNYQDGRGYGQNDSHGSHRSGDRDRNDGHHGNGSGSHRYHNGGSGGNHHHGSNRSRHGKKASSPSRGRDSRPQNGQNHGRRSQTRRQWDDNGRDSGNQRGGGNRGGHNSNNGNHSHRDRRSLDQWEPSGGGW